MRLLLIILLNFCFLFEVLGQPNQADLECRLYQTYVNDEMQRWPAIIQEMESMKDSSVVWQKEILLARYGVAGFYLGNRLEDEARDELEKAFVQLEKLRTKYPDVAAFYCLDACFHSYQIALSMVQAPILYPKHQSAIRKAQKLSEDEPLLWFEKANMLFYKPRLLGRDKEKAIEYYQKSLELLHRQEVGDCDWFEMMVQLFLLKAYFENEDEVQFHSLLAKLRVEHGELSWIRKFLDSRVVD
ncbi:hypothetical protein [Mangrovibacterium lignilyticum]|uniref:hypothetical protein n=1 Tax=Mangrovibacterium lignilyticum TaxID=2668052 RepID=UPI0013D1ACB8|nr:hypothetical protein [Mangrovibacterium lignilyticum]